MSIKQEIDTANEKVMNVFLNGQPTWMDVLPAGNVIPNMKENLILVAGPPIANDEMVKPVRAAVCGAAIHEGLAKTKDEAWKMVMDGEIIIRPAQDYACACGACMATSYSMPVIVAEDTQTGKRGFCALHPGTKKNVLRWGVYNEEVEADLVRFRDVYGPALGEAVRRLGGVNLRTILAKTAGMGDENHNRQPAASMAMAMELVPALLDCDIPQRDDVIREYVQNDRFFLHPMMAGAISVIQGAKHTPMSTIMVGMGGNGVEFGLQFSGTDDEWFTVPAPPVLGQFLDPTWTKDDILGYLGDSCVTEVYGLGGLSSIAGPSFARITGASFEEAKQRTENARAVCLGEHMYAPIPWDNYRGYPVGVDMRRVVALNIVPTSHGGSTHKNGGQGGIGSAEFPIECFKKGLAAFSNKIGGNQ
jgi:hypothetical protein